MDKYKKRINKVLGILNGRLPEDYCAPIKTYSTVYSLLRAEARQCNRTYKNLIAYYECYFKEQKENKTSYIPTKYFIHKENLKKRRVFRIGAISSCPVKLAIDNTSHLSDGSLAFLLLHEFNHIRSKQTATEKQCDQFAIRWSRKLIKEGLI